jgi:hypothetical protein
MKPLITLVETRAVLDPRHTFGAAWWAAFLSVVLILGVAFFTMLALSSGAFK